MTMLQDFRDNPGIGDQVDYLMHACQVRSLDWSRWCQAKPLVNLILVNIKKSFEPKICERNHRIILGLLEVLKKVVVGGWSCDNRVIKVSDIWFSLDLDFCLTIIRYSQSVCVCTADHNPLQLQMEERQVSEVKPETKRRGVEASFPCGVVSYRVGQVCQHRKYNY